MSILMDLSEVGDGFRQEGFDEIIPREGNVATEICVTIFQALVGCHQPGKAATFLSTLILEDVLPPSRALLLVENILIAYPAVLSADKPLEAIQRRGEGYARERAETLLRIIYNDRLNELAELA